MNLPDTGKLYQDMARGMPNRVECKTCGRVERVVPAECLRSGWPVCCGQTMYLVSKKPPAVEPEKE